MAIAYDAPSVNLIKTLRLDIVGERYQIISPVGASFGGASFVGEDNHTGQKVFMKYLICYRGEADRAKFMVERDALEHIKRHPGPDIVPNLVYSEEFPNIACAVIVTEFADGQSLSEWLSNLQTIGIDEKLCVFHRIVFALSKATLLFKHRDIHPGNIILTQTAASAMTMGHDEFEADPGVKIIDWGESLPVIVGCFEDEPDHNFVLKNAAPTLLGGSITSLPPEVFSPWRENTGFGGVYETWGLGILFCSIILEHSAPRARSLGNYVKDIADGTLQNWVDQQVQAFSSRIMPGGLILPCLLNGMLDVSPDTRLPLSLVGRILWDVRYEKLSITDKRDLSKYFLNPNEYIPPSGWKYSSAVDYN
jgi:serine/threonine protein kinase